MSPVTTRKLFRWIHILFGFPILGYIYGPPEEVLQYAPVFQWVIVPVLFLSGFLMWKGHVLARMFSKKTG